jgi:hypothetical protein
MEWDVLGLAETLSFIATAKPSECLGTASQMAKISWPAVTVITHLYHIARSWTLVRKSLLPITGIYRYLS